MAMNALHYGDCLDVLRTNLPDEAVDLVYVDPPAPTAADFNALFAAGGKGPATKAGLERWARWAEEALDELGPLDTDQRARTTLSALRSVLGPSITLDFLAYLAPRLLEMRRVLRQTGSLVVHADPSSSAYLRVLLDALFGSENFRGEIVWAYSRIFRMGRGLPRAHDNLLYYTRSDRYHFNAPGLEAESQRRKPSTVDSRTKNEGRLGDVWEIPLVSPVASERVGYATQRPLSLLTRVVAMATHPGDLVVDPFVGSGTALVAAEEMQRRWQGIDNSVLAIEVARRRLRDIASNPFEVLGLPHNVDEARSVAHRNSFEFAMWALSLVGAEPTASPSTRDRAPDGVIHFRESEEIRVRTVYIEVKAGSLGVAALRPLEQAITDGSADLAVLISLEEPSNSARQLANAAGTYGSQSTGRSYPRLQVVTVRQLLRGEGLLLPPAAREALLPALGQRDDHQPGA